MNQPGEIDEATAVWLKDLRRSWGHGGPMSWQADAADHFERQARELAALKAGPGEAETETLLADLRATEEVFGPIIRDSRIYIHLEQLARSHAAQTEELAEWRTATGCGNQTQVKALLGELRQGEQEEQDRADKAEEHLRLEREQREATKLRVGLQEASIESLKIYAEQGERRGFAGAVQALRDLRLLLLKHNEDLTVQELDLRLEHHRDYPDLSCPVLWQVADYLASLQPQPAPVDPLAKLREAKRDEIRAASVAEFEAETDGIIERLAAEQKGKSDG